MSDKIIPIRPGTPVVTAAADPEALAAIEDIIDRLRAGDVVGYVLVAEHRDGTLSSIRSGPFNIELMVGRLESLKFRLFEERR